MNELRIFGLWSIMIYETVARFINFHRIVGKSHLQCLIQIMYRL